MGAVKQSGALESTLGAIVAHPLRAKCLTILSDHTASPNELAKDLGEDVGNVSYHVKQLLKMGAIELASERPVRGAVEHFYRAIKRPLMSDDEYAGLSVEERLRFARLGLQFSVADAATAIEAKTFTQRHDHYLTRLPLTVDEEGWKELNEVYAEAFRRTVEVEAASAERMSKDPEAAGIPARVISMFFEMPQRDQR
ncbi:MAG TPA: winged helix-turn-helix domain-containing protein [Solirubrobacterales bacterium]|jgi:DNA-binding transcriptional ArsR family regulator|nr:winged helix-turn-helix domain-containing protein [Solirubrobacterales bacterium]